VKSRDEASATNTLAKEARTDRQLQWRPQLGLMECWTTVDEAGHGQFHFEISNVGGGPAVNCKAIALVPWNVNIWSLWRVGDIKSGDQPAQSLKTQQGLSV
jgi:hypothetical protein